MATAEELRKEFTDHMDAKGIKYEVIDEEDNVIRLRFRGEDDVSTKVYVDFDENGDNCTSVHFVSQDFAKCTAENVPAVLVKLNEINKRYRYAKFWLDSSDNTITADADALIFPGSAGEECMRFALLVSDIVEHALKDFGDLVQDNDELEALMRMLHDMMGK